MRHYEGEMTVAIFEENLIWSARLAKSVSSLGHEAIILDRLPSELPAADFAIVNLGSTKFDLANVVPELKAAGVHVIGHAGHKEKPLLAAGDEFGCDQVVSNSTLTFRLETLLRTPQ